jgi:phosphodiesterase/alkaline phosphatase D-like protein
MNRLLPIPTIIVALTVIATGSLFFPPPTAAQVPPPAKQAKRVHITQGPALESATESSAIITWTSNNPGGTDEHFGVVHYSADPKNLSETAKSHIRLNRAHSYTVFRVRVDGLKPKTTYYYTVDSVNARSASDGVTSPVKTFTTSSDALSPVVR